MNITAILHKDVLRYYRNPLRTALLFAIPIMLALLFSMVFGGDSGGNITIHVLVWDEDRGLISHVLGGAGNNPEMDSRINFELVGEEGLSMMEKGEASALIHFPENFSRDYLEGTPVKIGLVKNPAERFLPLVVEEGVGIVAEILSQASLVFRPELIQLEEMMDQGSFPSEISVAAMASGVTARLRGMDRLLFPPIISFEEIQDTEKPADSRSILAFFLPGLAMMGALFLAQNATRDILAERRAGLLKQMLTAPVDIGEYLVAKSIMIAGLAFVGFVLMIFFGAAFGISWGPPLMVSVMAFVSALVCAGTMVMIMSIAGSQAQADAISTVVIMFWCLLGGAFFPVSQMPDSVLPLARLTPVYWAVDGFSRIMKPDVGWDVIAPNLLVLTAIALVFSTGGLLTLRRRIFGGINR